MKEHHLITAYVILYESKALTTTSVNSTQMVLAVIAIAAAAALIMIATARTWILHMKRKI
jgi:hypothetical protein